MPWLLLTILDQKLGHIENKTYIFRGLAKSNLSTVPQIFGGPAFVRILLIHRVTTHRSLGRGDGRRFLLGLLKKGLKMAQIRPIEKRSKYWSNKDFLKYSKSSMSLH